MKSENRKYIIRQADYEDKDLDLSQFYNMPDIIIIKGHKYILGSGTSDHVSVHRSGDRTYVLCTNFNLNYAGLQFIDHENNDTDDIIFISNTDEIDDLNKDFFDYSENSQADILGQWEQ